MSKKTILIAWRFKTSDPNEFSKKTGISPEYEIIEFFTPADRDDLVPEENLNQLNKIIGDINSDLFVFIHKPNFKNSIDSLMQLNNPKQNKHIIPFEGGHSYVYDKFIFKDELKVIDRNKFAEIFNELEVQYGLKSKLNVILGFLHICLSEKPSDLSLLTNAGIKVDISCKSEKAEGKTIEDLFRAFEVGNKESLVALRDGILEQAGVE
jgi:hypothetical protein